MSLGFLFFCWMIGIWPRRQPWVDVLFSIVGRQLWPRSTIVGVGIVVGGLGLFLCIIMGDDLVIFIFWVYQNKSW